MKGTPWAAAALLASLPGCDGLLGEKTHHCGATGAVCPEALACAPAPALCGPPDDVAACAGIADKEACSSGANPVGYCSSGVCQACTPDLAICHYPGWTQMTSLAVDLYGVWVAGPADVYAVGDGGAFHYDGEAWTPVGALSKKLLGVWGVAGHLFAAEVNGALYEWDGAQWIEHAGPSNILNGAYAATASDAFVVGFAGEVGHYQGGALAVSTLTPPTPAHDLYGIWGSGSGDVFAVGYQVIFHYDGSSWSLSLPSTLYALQAISGTGAGDVFTVGNCQVSGCTGPASLHYTGAWQAAEPITQNLDDHAQGVWASSSTVFAVGSVLVSIQPVVRKSAAFRRDATGWHVDMLDSQYELNAVAGSSATDVYAVGAHGTIWHYGGP